MMGKPGLAGFERNSVALGARGRMSCEEPLEGLGWHWRGGGLEPGALWTGDGGDGGWGGGGCVAVIPGSRWVVQLLAPLRVGKERSGLQTGSCWLLCERSREQGRGQAAGLHVALCF